MRLINPIVPAVFLILATGQLRAADAPTEFTAGPFKFTRPPSWTWVQPTSSMRQAELKVEDQDKKQSAEVVFFFFGSGQGGDAKANVERWYSQFAEERGKIFARFEEKSSRGLKITYAFAEGTYLSGPPMGRKIPMKNYALIGAILEDAGGNVFVKMTGPIELTKTAEAEFRKMVEDARK